MMMKRNPAIAAVTAAAIALTTAGTAPAFAASQPKAELQTTTASDATEFSARKRHRHYYRGHRGGDAAAAAAFSAIVGGIAAYAAAREYRKAHERSYYYGRPYGYDGYHHRKHYRYW